MNTYYKWLKAQEYRTDNIGNLSRIFSKNEDKLPEKKTKRNFLAFLIHINPDPKILEDYYSSWEEYKKFKKITRK
jgi:hypothetical protein